MRIAERVAGAHLPEPGERDNVAGIGLLDVLAIVGMHQQHPADALLAVLGGIDHARPALETARVDAAERDGADERIVHDLEGEHRQRLGIRSLAHDFIALAVDALDRRHIERRRQVVDHRVEQRLHAFVLERRAGEHRKECSGEHRLADEALESGFVGLFALEIGGHGIVVELDRGLDHPLPILLGLFEHVGGNFDIVILGAERLVVPNNTDHAHEVDNALELVLASDRELNRHRLGAQTIDDVAQALEEIRAHFVHLVAKDDARDLVLVALSPHGLGLRLDALIAVEHDYRTVQHAQAAFHLDGEIDVTGRIDDVEPLVFPVGRGCGRGDGDAALLLLLHPIHRRGAFVHLAHLVALAGVIEDPLGGRRLPGIDVGHDAEIAVVLDRMAAGHERLVS